MNEPLVSVIMPAHNAQAFVAQSIQSVFDQTFPDWELIVCNDASTDATERVIDTYRADARVRYIAVKTTRGAAGARNAALALSRGRYVAFLDADDVWAAGKLERQLEFAETTRAPVTFHSYQELRSDERRPAKIIHAPSRISYGDLLKTNSIGLLTAMMDTQQTGRRQFAEGKQREDYRYWLSILRPGASHGTPLYARGMPDVLAFYRVHPGSKSANKKRAAYNQWRVYRDSEGLSPLRAGYYFAHYALNGYRKHRPE